MSNERAGWWAGPSTFFGDSRALFWPAVVPARETTAAPMETKCIPDHGMQEWLPMEKLAGPHTGSAQPRRITATCSCIGRQFAFVAFSQ